MDKTIKDVTYTYGTSSNTGTNANGRLLRVDDGTGYQIFSYDRLGNVTENTRAIALPFEDSVYNFRMLFEYDTWNRVQRIVYPDSEVVTYNYDLGGNLNRVHTYKAGHRDTLIKNILYDEFGHRTQVNFGNGVTTNYTYDILQRLSTLQTYSNNASLQKILYSFDLEDNITKVENTAGGANGLGGAYVNTYNYDGLYRLTAANGSYSGNNTNYSLEMSYTPAGRLCSKLQDFTATGNIYAYSTNNKPHAARRIYNGITNELSNLRWDNNGNLAQQTIYSVNNNVPTYQTMRMLFWDEDDRLNLVAGDGYLSYYAYGHDGNRAIKMTGNAAIDQTGTLLNSTNLENITIYPNEYLTVTQAEYTKYYYAGGNRIASKIGTGGFGKMARLCTQDLNLTANANSLFGNALQLVTSATNQPADEYPADVCGGYSISTELLTNPLPDFYISNTALNFTQNNLLQQFRQNLAGGTEAVYYFHSDHLGSASWITDGSGLPVQHLQYLPFGEHFVNEQSTGYFERFTFTGKERDAETGYYYHGARFNSSDIGWLSVDPMAEKYPSISPFAYCAWNPIIAKDPNGMDTVRTPNGLANVGKGYKATPDGMYLYGDGLQTKKWNPYLEIGGVVGERGGYENCDVAELNPYGMVLSAMTNISNLNNVIGVSSDGCFNYTRTKYDKLSHGTTRNPIKPIGQSIPGKALIYGGGAITVLLSANEVNSNIQEYGIDSPETYSAIGGAVGTGVSLWASTAAGASVGSICGGIGAVPGAIIGFVVGVGVNICLELGGRYVGKIVYEKTH